MRLILAGEGELPGHPGAPADAPIAA